MLLSPWDSSFPSPFLSGRPFYFLPAGNLIIIIMIPPSTATSGLLYTGKYYADKNIHPDVFIINIFHHLLSSSSFIFRLSHLSCSYTYLIV